MDDVLSATVVMKNCDPFVFGPEFAIACRYKLRVLPTHMVKGKVVPVKMGDRSGCAGVSRPVNYKCTNDRRLAAIVFTSNSYPQMD
jgi:hypothetical protein